MYSEAFKVCEVYQEHGVFRTYQTITDILLTFCVLYMNDFVRVRLASNASMQALWPYHTYRPVTWDRYYVNEHHEKHPSVSSGVAAGVTIGIFFIVFLFTFGCRIYSQYADRSQSQSPQTQGDLGLPD
ncbi:hypothetical protein COOONC_12870 [Cooperia oncophora]